MSRNIKRIALLFTVIMLLGLVAAACVPSDLQNAITSTQTDVQALRSEVKALNTQIANVSKSMGPVIDEQAPSGWERDMKEHIVRGRADFIAYNDSFNSFSKSVSGNLAALAGSPASKTAPAKPGIAQNIDGKLDKLVGIAAKPAVPAKTDPKTGKVSKAIAAVPAVPGLIEKSNADIMKELAAIKAKLDSIEKSLAATPATTSTSTTSAVKTSP